MIPSSGTTGKALSICQISDWSTLNTVFHAVNLYSITEFSLRSDARFREEAEDVWDVSMDPPFCFCGLQEKVGLETCQQSSLAPFSLNMGLSTTTVAVVVFPQ